MAKEGQLAWFNKPIFIIPIVILIVIAAVCLFSPGFRHEISSIFTGKNIPKTITYSCNYTWTQEIIDQDTNQVLWKCPISNPYCKAGTSQCCEYDFTTKTHYNCIDMKIIESPDNNKNKKCSDFDGENILVKSKCNDSIIKEDYCERNFGNILFEYVCLDKACFAKRINCLNYSSFCNNGKCVLTTQDSDGDGWTDLDEHNQGTNPDDPGSYPNNQTQPTCLSSYPECTGSCDSGSCYNVMNTCACGNYSDSTCGGFCRNQWINYTGGRIAHNMQECTGNEQYVAGCCCMPNSGQNQTQNLTLPTTWSCCKLGGTYFCYQGNCPVDSQYGAWQFISGNYDIENVCKNNCYANCNSDLNCPSGYKCFAWGNESECRRVCTDTDNGIDYSTKGVCTDWHTPGIFEDWCAPHLVEYYCKATRYKWKDLTTVYECTTDTSGCTCINGSCPGMRPIGTMFLTKGSWTGNLGGVSGADAKCQSEASSASLSGIWVALISNSSLSAKDRIPDTMYKRTDGALIANSKADLFDGSINASINRGADGSYVHIEFAYRSWTGTNVYGDKLISKMCSGWTSNSGNGFIGNNDYFTDARWIITSDIDCGANSAQLYCVRVS